MIGNRNISIWKALVAGLVLSLPAGPLLAQEGNEPAYEGSIADLADALGSNLWIVSGFEKPLEAQLQVVVMGPRDDLIEDRSRPFQLGANEDAKGSAFLSWLDGQWSDGQWSDELKAPYDGKYGIPMARILASRPLLALLGRAGFEPELAIEIGAVNPDQVDSGVILVSLPCCKPLDEKTLLSALDEAGLVGEKGIVGRNGVVREGHGLLFFGCFPVNLDEANAPGFGERRKDVLQGVFIHITATR